MTASPRLLIVDDSPEDCATYQRYLEQGGAKDFTFDVAHSAASGLARCRQSTPDCVLLDFNLPDSDGLDFLTQLRKEQGENGPPVVMVTGQGNEAVAVQAMKLGAQDYLIKGSSADGLRRSIQGAIQQVALQRQIEEQQRELARLSADQARLVVELEQRASELSDADRRKNEFLAVLAHELRNPLGPIRNAAEIIRLANVSLPEEAEQARAIIDRQVGHMARLIDDLLDVSRIVRGKILLRKELVDLSSLVRSTTADHRGEFDKADLNLALDVPLLPTWILGDPTRLAQVLSNILDNARKFTPRDGTITVSLAATPDGTALLRVADTGEGVDPMMLEHLFETFSQADRSLDRGRGGLGLGLAIVKGLVELHEGKVSAVSKGMGQGCEIAVMLPLTAAPTERMDVPVGSQPSATALRVLVVEDNLDAAASLKALLQKLGHQVAVAHTGLAALATAREFHPELVLCDIGLADGMTGYVVAEKFREDPEIASAFLVALTGYGREEDRQRAREAGFDLHLIKPIAFDTLQSLPSYVSTRT
jgi:signal transduction histidine kinase